MRYTTPGGNRAELVDERVAAVLVDDRRESLGDEPERLDAADQKRHQHRHRRDGEIVVGHAVEAAARRSRDRPEHRLHHRQPLLGREQRLLAGMNADRHHELVAQRHGVADDVEMAVGDGIERPRIKRDA